MRNRFIGSVFALAAMLAFPVFTLAQNAAAPDKFDPRNLSGVWTFDTKEPRFLLTKDALPMQDWAAEKYNYNKDAEDPATRRGRNELNPDFKCFPRGPTRAWLNSEAPIEIISTPQKLLIMFEWGGETRRIWVDGRDHPEDPPLTWQGHSIGKWEGDTLVIDTIRINDYTWLDHAGHVHSDSIHLVERIRRDGDNRLILEMTIDDPMAYTKPFTVRRTFLRSRYELEPYLLCEDLLLHGKPVP